MHSDTILVYQSQNSLTFMKNVLVSFFYIQASILNHLVPTASKYAISSSLDQNNVLLFAYFWVSTDFCRIIVHDNAFIFQSFIAIDVRFKNRQKYFLASHAIITTLINSQKFGHNATKYLSNNIILSIIKHYFNWSWYQINQVSSIINKYFSLINGRGFMQSVWSQIALWH